MSDKKIQDRQARNEEAMRRVAMSNAKMGEKEQDPASIQEEQMVQQYIHSYSDNQSKPGRIMLGFFKGHEWNMVLTMILLVVKQSPVWVLPIITANIINVATYSQENSWVKIWVNVAVIMVFLLQNIASSYAQASVFSKVTRAIEMNLRGALVRRLQHLSISFHKEMQSGRLLSKVIRDVENVETLLYQAVGALVNIFLDVTIAVVVISCNSPTVLLFFLCVVPVAVGTVYFFRKPIRNNNREFRQEMEATQAAMAEMVELIPVTRAHGLENEEITKMDRKLRRIEESGRRLDKINMLFGATSWVVFQSFQVLCLGFTSMLAYKGKITVGEVVLYQTYFTQIVGQISNLINLYPNLTKGVESVKSIGEIVGANDLEKNNAIVPLGELDGRVSFQDVGFRYRDGDHAVLQDFNLEVPAGTSVAFVGGSGAGKSTVLNLMIGFDEPTSGKILVDGINMANLDLNEYRSQIAMVPQNTILFSGSIKDNVTYGTKDVSDEEVWNVLKEVGMDDVISAMPDGIYTKLGEHGGTLSGGQRQRISIARALLRKPRIIIFDEATSALDSESERKVQQATNRMMKQCTTFMVAHRLSTIQDADLICVMDQGKIVEQGTYEELMAKKDKFYRLKMLQS